MTTDKSKKISTAKLIWFMATYDFKWKIVKKCYRDSVLTWLSHAEDLVVASVSLVAGAILILTWPLWKPAVNVVVALRHRETAEKIMTGEIFRAPADDN